MSDDLEIVGIVESSEISAERRAAWFMTTFTSTEIEVEEYEISIQQHFFLYKPDIKKIHRNSPGGLKMSVLLKISKYEKLEGRCSRPSDESEVGVARR
ncbi:hypothetical protein SUGI_1105360 [Cryptomeria japonica]|nr:hypothetical protein SUGI_1105360 [Cryptomeria japonica]